MMMRALILIALVTGCGFGPEEDFTGQRAGDGIAPWADQGPVQICFGNEFIGPSDTEPGGLCASRNLAESPCADDGDCRSRETCVCGRCTVQYCTATSDCGQDRVCSFAEKRCDRVCARNDDCPVEDVCFNGTCRGQCEVDGDCQTGEVCNSVNRCITVACSDDPDCLGTERCFVQRLPRLALEPTVLPRSSASEPRFTMWLELADTNLIDRRSIWRATSTDGRRFRIDPASPVLEDGLVAGAPSVVRTPGGYGLYYEEGDGVAIRYASSVDGIAFGEPSTVLTGGAAGAAVHAPSAVVLPEAGVAVYFESGDGASIDLATGPVGGTLSRQGAVLSQSDVRDPPADQSAGAQFWVDIEALRSPHALVSSGPDGRASLRLWFAGWGRESGDSYQFGEIIPIPPTYSIGYAAAIDPSSPGELIPWSFNPVLDRVQVFLEHRSELTPAVTQVTDADGTPRGGYLMYYLDAIADTSRGTVMPGRLGVAGNGDFVIDTGAAE